MSSSSYIPLRVFVGTSFDDLITHQLSYMCAERVNEFDEITQILQSILNPETTTANPHLSDYLKNRSLTLVNLAIEVNNIQSEVIKAERKSILRREIVAKIAEIKELTLEQKQQKVDEFIRQKERWVAQHHPKQPTIPFQQIPNSNSINPNKVKLSNNIVLLPYLIEFDKTFRSKSQNNTFSPRSSIYPYEPNTP